MLASWLGSVELEEFRASILRRGPFALPSTASEARALLDWDVLARRYETEILDRYLPPSG